MALGPLDADETAALAMHLAGNALSPTQAAHLHQTTEGNPLFVVETMQTEARRSERGEQDAVLLHALPAKVHMVIQAASGAAFAACPRIGESCRDDWPCLFLSCVSQGR